MTDVDFQLVGIADLVDRWVYTRQGLHKLITSGGFPPPIAAINRGRTKIWKLADIAHYERLHPEVLSEGLKRDKVRQAFWCIMNLPGD